jgi:beta-glucanase (GH16 family)
MDVTIIHPGLISPVGYRFPSLESTLFRMNLMAKLMGIYWAVLFGILAFGCDPGLCQRHSEPNCHERKIAKPSGGYWKCTFDDEFNGTELDTNEWTPQQTSDSSYYTGPVGSRACYVNDPQNVSVSEGYLHLTARKERAPFTCKDPDGDYITDYTAGMVSTVHGFHQKYGRFEVRAKLPETTLNGLQETLWLWPVSQTYGPFPRSGEIDFAESYSEWPTLDIPYIHYDYEPSTVNPKTNTNTVTAHTCTIDFKRFNTYVVLWEPGTITVMYNGEICLVDHYIAKGLPSYAPFDQPFFFALTQALGVPTNAFNPALTPLPAILQIDYVRAWK